MLKLRAAFSGQLKDTSLHILKHRHRRIDRAAYAMAQTEKLIAFVTHSGLQLWEAPSAYTWMLLYYVDK